MARWPVRMVCVYALLFLPVQISASREVSISTGTDAISESGDMEITASVSGFTEGEAVHVKGVFFKPGVSGYFGYTFDGSNWIKNSAKNVDQRRVIIGDWDGKIRVKSDWQDGDFMGSGQYEVKLGYYAGDYTSVAWSVNSVPVFLTAPAPTSTPTSTPTNSPTPTRSPSRTPTPVPTHTGTASPSPAGTTIPVALSGMPKQRRDPAITVHSVETSRSGTPVLHRTGVLGAQSQERIPTASPSGFVKRTVAVSLLFVSSGMLLISSVLFFRTRAADILSV